MVWNEKIGKVYKFSLTKVNITFKQLITNMISKNITGKLKKNCLIKTTRNMKIVKKLIVLCKFKSYNKNIRKKVSFA